MKNIFMGYDPKLGAKFLQENDGSIIGVVPSAMPSLEERAEEAFVEEFGTAPNAQQIHDMMQTLRKAEKAQTTPPKSPSRSKQSKASE